jgi:hypothetical protein
LPCSNLTFCCFLLVMLPVANLRLEQLLDHHRVQGKFSLIVDQSKIVQLPDSTEDSTRSENCDMLVCPELPIARAGFDSQSGRFVVYSFPCRSFVRTYSESSNWAFCSSLINLRSHLIPRNL